MVIFKQHITIKEELEVNKQKNTILLKYGDEKIHLPINQVKELMEKLEWIMNDTNTS